MSATMEAAALRAALRDATLRDEMRAPLTLLHVSFALSALSSSLRTLAEERTETTPIQLGSVSEARAAVMWAYEIRVCSWEEERELWPLVQAFREAVRAEAEAIILEARIVQRQRMQRRQARQLVLSFGGDLGGEA